ncbi:MAG TPA: PspC domain-containing protein [Frankiaceae bacterium]|nr:PspC domain-containing protein [Frankiaceae bacterium]
MTEFPDGSVGPAARPPLVRRRDERLVAGVAAGIAAHLDLPLFAVRLATAILAGSGLGALAYVALWVLLPSGAAADPDAPGRPEGRRRILQVLGYLLVGSLTSALLGAVGRPFGGGVVGPAVVAGIGALLIWRRAPDDQRSAWASDARRVGRHYGGRLSGTRLPGGTTVWLPVVGTVLVVAGVAAFLAAHDALAQARAGALAILATLAGVALVAGPWLLRTGRDLAQERRARIRAQERAAVAAHVHDSVLQTLALLQARAGDPGAVRRLARRQERDLRAWLYGPADGQQAGTAGSAGSAGRTLAIELRVISAEIEDDTGVGVEVVVVGDAPLDDALRELTAAAREAVLNAAKSSGAPTIDVYAEVEGARVGIWVRDRGVGFDPAAVGEDRHGIRDSICGRMKAAGGSSTIRSAPGQGTEVELLLPLHTGRQPHEAEGSAG